MASGNGAWAYITRRTTLNVLALDNITSKCRREDVFPPNWRQQSGTQKRSPALGLCAAAPRRRGNIIFSQENAPFDLIEKSEDVVERHDLIRYSHKSPAFAKIC
ncbi:uncharacterized protein RAG0_15786 [Rhynchosporium agropyri]|uniref:Uncharacterized protein n=1 Tax=Rhynchosporium agropyri TaxID=914238 RepID=A0A1E1LMJ9_9HELO|nr:uncharacterized protein RAG0_15786 [Rhynchosporium agropyri]